MLKFEVKNQAITRTDDFFVVSDSQNYLTAEFTFSEEWTAPVMAVFGYGGEYYNVSMEDGVCIVPWEVIKAPFFTVSVFCGDRVTANIAEVAVKRSGYVESEASREPTPDVYNRLIGLSEETREIAQSVREDADNGVFKGDKGDKGEKGDKGDKGNTLCATFEVNKETGNLEMTIPDGYGGVNFEINDNGYLEVHINE